MEGMKLLRLWCCFFVFYISNLLSYIQNNFSYELARPIMGTIFLVYLLASERSERDTLMSVQLRIADIYIIYYYILYIVRAIFVLITRKEGGA